MKSLRFLIPLPEKAQTIGPPVIWPDGHSLVYRLNTEDGKELLWVRPVSSLDARPLAGTEGAIQPFWSPDSRSIGFFAAGKLKGLTSRAEHRRRSATRRLIHGGTWSRDGVIICLAGTRRTDFTASRRRADARAHHGG